jgi:hypothetical protein
MRHFMARHYLTIKALNNDNTETTESIQRKTGLFPEIWPETEKAA